MAAAEFIYIGDPMCSWCWGFAPVLETLRDRYQGRAEFTVRVGGLRAGGQAEPMVEHRKAMLRHHWEAVRERSGQPFDFSFLERDGFIYDTEPSCRAVVTARSMVERKVYPYFWKIQRAFYAENSDPTDFHLLRALAGEMGLDGEGFERRFHSQAMKDATMEDFVETRRWGVAGYPSVLLRHGKELSVLSRGYMEEEILAPRLESWLEGIRAQA